jgi:hypothetical protein
MGVVRFALRFPHAFLLCGDCGGGLADHVNDEVGLGEHDDVAAVRLDFPEY